MHDSWKSKKLWFSVGMVMMAFVYAVLGATIMPNLLKFYENFTGILEFFGGAFLLGNLGNKFIISKSNPEVVNPPKPTVQTPKSAAQKEQPQAGSQKVPEE